MNSLKAKENTISPKPLVDAERYRDKILVSLFLIIAILVCYWQIQHSNFINLDDTLYVTKNRRVQTGLTWQGAVWAFTTTKAANWHPLTWLSHMLDYELYGLNPAGHHWTNLLFHMANSLLLFLVFNQMTGTVRPSAFVAALFALHPLHVESVAWIAERKDVLSTFFGFLSIAAYIRYVEKRRLISYLLCLLFLCLGLMAKPMLVTLPFVLLLLDIWPLRRFYGEGGLQLQSAGVSGTEGRRVLSLILEKVPFFVPVLFSCLITIRAQSSGGAVISLEHLSLHVRIANAVVAYVKYIGQAIWPRHLSIYYPHPGDALPAWKIFWGALLIVGVSVLAVRMLKNHPYIAIGWFWFLGTLVPVIGLVQIGAQSMADRYTYIPLIGLFIIIAWGVPGMLMQRSYQRIVLTVSAVVILLILSARTSIQVQYWKNSMMVMKNAVENTERNWLAHNQLGLAFYRQKKIDMAISNYKMALRFRPGYALAHNNLGIALAGVGKLEEAAFHLKKALHFNPRLAIAHYNTGAFLAKQNNAQAAMAHFAEAIRIDPEYVEAYHFIGVILDAWGNTKGARNFFSKAVQIDPGFDEARKRLENNSKILSNKKVLNGQ